MSYAITLFRVRLFNLGDKLSDAERKKRLRGQYRRMSQLSSHIFWMDLGEAGYLDFRKSLKQKRLAKQMAADDPDLFEGISAQRAQKMISKAVEVQEKANEVARKSRAAARFRQDSSHQKAGGRTPPKKKSYQPRKQQRSPRSQPRKTERGHHSSSRYAFPRKRGGGHRS